MFLRHIYGYKMEVAAITELLTLTELHSITCQFEQVELGKEVKERLRELLNTEERRPCALVRGVYFSINQYLFTNPKMALHENPGTPCPWIVIFLHEPKKRQFFCTW